MRLTLRTLLAYLDRILDPADANELQHKVEESERATQLVQRIERVLHERGTEALDIHATRHGRNANSVAEYLDNQMPPEHVAEFERVCLESDAHLAETAACHQILTKVLGQRADVAPTLRQRLYALPSTTGALGDGRQDARPSDGLATDAGSHRSLRVERPDAAAPAARAASAPIQAVPIDRPSAKALPSEATGVAGLQPTKLAKSSKPTWDADERWTTAPDYLKKPRRGRWQPWAIGLAIVVLLAVAGLRGMGPLDASHPLAQRFGVSHLLPAPGAMAKADPKASKAEGATIASGMDSEDRPRDAEPDATAMSGEAGEDDTAGDARSQDPNASHALETHSGAAPLAAAELNPSETDTTGDAEESFERVPADDGSQMALSADEAATSDDRNMAPSEDTSTTDGAEGTEGAEMASDATETSVPDMGLAANGEQATDADSTRGQEADESVAVADEAAEPSSDDGAVAPEPTDLINPLEAVATHQNEPAELIPALPGLKDTPEEVSDPGALGATDGQPTEALAEENREAPPVATDVGRFLNDQQVLLQFDPATESWLRMTAGTPLKPGQRLLSFPTFRPPIVLATGMQVTLIGATELEVMPPGAEQTPVFSIRYGRAAVATFTSAGTSLGIRWGQERMATLTMDDMTTLAFEVQRPYLPGADPSVPENQAHDLLFVYVMSGNAQWSTGSGEPLTLSAGKRLALVDDRAPQVTDAAELPLWIDGRDARPRDPIAAQDLAKRLAADRPVDLVLSELSVEKRVEQRSLAICCLAYLGQFDPLLNGFSDEKLRAYWPMQYEVFTHLMSQGPEAMNQLKSALVQHHGEEDGRLMFEMLLGYTPQQLLEGGAEALVDHLNHPSSAVRFVANQTLRAISGLPTLYQAHGNERARRTAVAKWRSHLQQGKIAYANAPEVVQLLNDVKPATPQ